MIPIILIGAAYLIGKTMEVEKYANGGKVNLLAPNGKPSKLTPEQWHLVRTPAFKEWFGDWENDAENSSKVIDEETKEPLVCYHGFMVGGGAGKQFYQFKNLPSFFSTSIEFAERYASTKSMDAGLDADIHTYACFLNIRKLFDPKNEAVIEIARQQLPESIKVHHGTMWFMDAKIPKEELIEEMQGIITIAADEMANDILKANVGDVVREKVSESQYENKILVYKDEDWAYTVDKNNFDEAIAFEVAEFILKERGSYVITIKYKNKYLPNIIFNENTYSYEINKDPLYLEYNDKVEERKKYYIDNILTIPKLDSKGKYFEIYVTNPRGSKKSFLVQKRNLKTYKTTTKNNWTMFENDTIQKFLISNNFNGWYAYERGDKTYAVYEANNIKLADGSNTTFDGSNPDIRYGKGGEITDWDVEFTGGSLKGQKLSEQEIEFIDVYSNNIYSLTFTNDSQFYAKTIEVIGLLSITDNVVKISVIFDNDKWKDQKVIRKLQKMANDSNRIIVNNNSKLRSEKSLFPFLLVSKKDADNYDIASQFVGKLDTPKKAMTKSFVQDFIDSGDYVEQIKKGRDVKGVIEQIKKYGLEVPQEILSLIKK